MESGRQSGKGGAAAELQRLSQGGDSAFDVPPQARAAELGTKMGKSTPGRQRCDAGSWDGITAKTQSWWQSYSGRAIMAEQWRQSGDGRAMVIAEEGKVTEQPQRQGTRARAMKRGRQIQGGKVKMAQQGMWSGASGAAAVDPRQRIRGVMVAEMVKAGMVGAVQWRQGDRSGGRGRGRAKTAEFALP